MDFICNEWFDYHSKILRILCARDTHIDIDDDRDSAAGASGQTHCDHIRPECVDTHSACSTSIRETDTLFESSYYLLNIMLLALEQQDPTGMQILLLSGHFDLRTPVQQHQPICARNFYEELILTNPDLPGPIQEMWLKLESQDPLILLVVTSESATSHGSSSK